MTDEQKTPVQWRERSPQQRTLTIIRTAGQLALLVAALADLSRRPAEQINGDKRRWYGIVFIAYVGPILYFVFGRKKPEAASTENPQVI